MLNNKQNRYLSQDNQGLYCFDGEFRKRPSQSFGGANQNLSRAELLQRAAHKRRDRENNRRVIKATTTLQAFTRGVLLRNCQRKENQLRFDNLKAECIRQPELALSPPMLGQLLQNLLILYRADQDLPRLLWLVQVLVTQPGSLLQLMGQEPFWRHRASRLLYRCLAYMASCPVAHSINSPLRLLEVLTHPSGSLPEPVLYHIWSYLIRKGYFKYWQVILTQRVPAFLSQDCPTHHLAASLEELLLRPLKHSPDHKMVEVLVQQMLRGPWSPQFQHYVFPRVAKQLGLLLEPGALLAGASTCSQPPSIYLLYSLLVLVEPRFGTLGSEHSHQFLEAVVPLLSALPTQAPPHEEDCPSSSDDEDEEDSKEQDAQSISKSRLMSLPPQPGEELAGRCLVLLMEPGLVALCCRMADQEQNTACLAHLCHALMVAFPRIPLPRLAPLASLIFRPRFLRSLWLHIHSLAPPPMPSTLAAPTPVLQKLAQGVCLSPWEKETFLPPLIVFCAFLSHLLPTMYDEELCLETSPLPFSAAELPQVGLVLRDVCLGLVELSYPDIRPLMGHAMKPADVRQWRQLFRCSVSLLQQIYLRDVRHRFCPPEHWISLKVKVPSAANLMKLRHRRFHGHSPFIGPHHYTREELEDEGPPMTSGEVRHLTVLRELPFVLPFHTRVNILQSLLDIDRQENQHNAEFGLGPRIHLAIRRNYIYEDAYNKLSQENEPNPKLMIRVKLINTMGLDEPGIDGGGIFREFLGELLKTAFDPTRGFFVATTDQLLYPNPAVHLLMPDFPKHYYFIGRMLGKAMYENMLLELPLADFFLAKLLNARGSNVDVHHLASLDPMIYKNLLSLKTYEGDVADLGLDFTAISSGLGESKLVELKPGGANIPVTEDNRIEYIHLMADYKLNRQIRAQTQAFKEGMASVIDLSWLRMFNYSELQTLISGAHVPVDVEDLRAHAVYNGGYTAEHPTILAFWSTVESFSETQRRQLLRFVTSCSRPPLLGFRELHPNFCIQRAGDVDRLPTASTCMNLLKLPEFQDQQTLREKLLYAIESGAGFELS